MIKRLWTAYWNASAIMAAFVLGVGIGATVAMCFLAAVIIGGAEAVQAFVML